MFYVTYFVPVVWSSPEIVGNWSVDHMSWRGHRTPTVPEHRGLVIPLSSTTCSSVPKHLYSKHIANGEFLAMIVTKDNKFGMAFSKE